MEEFFWIVKNHHSLSSWRFSPRIFKIFFIYLNFLYVDSYTLGRISQIVCSKWEIYQNNDSPYLGGIRTWVTGFWVICFFLYTHHCLCACETEVQKHWLWWCGPSDGPEVQPDGGNYVCSLNWIFWNSWECKRKKWGCLQGMEVYCTRIFCFLLQMIFA